MVSNFPGQRQTIFLRVDGVFHRNFATDSFIIYCISLVPNIPHISHTPCWPAPTDWKRHNQGRYDPSSISSASHLPASPTHLLFEDHLLLTPNCWHPQPTSENHPRYRSECLECDPYILSFRKPPEVQVGAPRMWPIPTKLQKTLIYTVVTA